MLAKSLFKDTAESVASSAIETILAEALATVSASVKANCEAKKNCVGKNKTIAINSPTPVACLKDENKDFNFESWSFM
jgi:hypothetical protein